MFWGLGRSAYMSRGTPQINCGKLLSILVQFFQRSWEILLNLPLQFAGLCGYLEMRAIIQF